MQKDGTWTRTAARTATEAAATARGPRLAGRQKGVRGLRIAAGILAGTGALGLAIAAFIAADDSRTGALPLFTRLVGEQRAVESFIPAWYLIAVPLAGLLHSPVAILRRARLAPGWALLAGYWLWGVAMTLLARVSADLFPAAGAPGKSGGMLGATLFVSLLMLAGHAIGGMVFVSTGPEDLPLREHLRRWLLEVAPWSLAGAGVLAAYPLTALAPPQAERLAQLSGFVWGLLLGLAMGFLARAAAQWGPSRAAARAGNVRTATRLGLASAGIAVLVLGLSNVIA
ncbi:hypothetical protein [Streptomyces sp. CA-132043]|uniref:hypothetical protein n=1 Tax=Streptomyces sp. CA-132043 TaxID=3240048 RepID=UPI003D8FA15B